MTQKQLATYVRFLTKTDSVTFTDDDILALLNIAKDDIAGEVIKANEDYFGVPATTNLIANQREYPFADDILGNIKRVEVAFATDTPLAYIKLKEFDLTGYNKGTDEAAIVGKFGNLEGQAFFDIFRRAMRIFSGTIISVTAGVKLWYMHYPADFADLTSTVDMSVDPSSTKAGFPRPLHELLGRRISIIFKTSKEVPILLTESEDNYGLDLFQKIDTLKGMNLDREVIGRIPYEDGQDT